MRWQEVKYLHTFCRKNGLVFRASSCCAPSFLQSGHINHKFSLLHDICCNTDLHSFTKKTMVAIRRCHASRNGSETSEKRPWKILFFGTDKFSEHILEALDRSRLSAEVSVVEGLEVVSNPGETTVRKYAESAYLKIHDWPIGDLTGLFDVGVLASFGHLIPAKVIKMFPFGIVNVHPSLLPRWRGAAPIIHTILAGDTTTGVSIMRLRPKRFDVGGVLSKVEFNVPENTTNFSLRDKLGKIGGELLLETLRDLPDLKEDEQSEDGVTLAPKVKSSMACLDWASQSCAAILRQHRALSEMMPLRSEFSGKSVKLLDLRSITQDTEDRTSPGTVLYDKDGNTLQIKCQDGWVNFEHIVIKKKMSAKDFYNGYISKMVDKKLCLTSLSNGLDDANYQKLIKPQK